MRIIVRADSGYFVGALLDLLDAYGHGYLIKVKLKNLVALLTGITVDSHSWADQTGTVYICIIVVVSGK